MLWPAKNKLKLVKAQELFLFCAYNVDSIKSISKSYSIYFYLC
jgi:hypothetical protein